MKLIRYSLNINSQEEEEAGDGGSSEGSGGGVDQSNTSQAAIRGTNPLQSEDVLLIVFGSKHRHIKLALTPD